MAVKSRYQFCHLIKRGSIEKVSNEGRRRLIKRHVRLQYCRMPHRTFMSWHSGPDHVDSARPTDENRVAVPFPELSRDGRVSALTRRNSRTDPGTPWIEWFLFQMPRQSCLHPKPLFSPPPGCGRVGFGGVVYVSVRVLVVRHPFVQ